MNHTNKVYNIHGGGELSELYLCGGEGRRRNTHQSPHLTRWKRSKFTVALEILKDCFRLLFLLGIHPARLTLHGTLRNHHHLNLQLSDRSGQDV